MFVPMSQIQGLALMGQDPIYTTNPQSNCLFEEVLSLEFPLIKSICSAYTLFKFSGPVFDKPYSNQFVS